MRLRLFIIKIFISLFNNIYSLGYAVRREVRMFVKDLQFFFRSLL